MALIRTLTDGVSTLRFYDQNGSPNAKTFCSFVTWEYSGAPGRPQVIRINDFCAEPINNIRNGISGGKYPLKVDSANIIGYTPQCDNRSGDINDLDFYGGSVRQCDLVGPLSVQFMYTTVNEFYEGYGCYGVQNSDLGNVVVDISNT
jgi:hypothetical protein